MGKSNHMRKGLAAPAVIGIILVIAALLGIGYYASRDKTGNGGAGDGTVVQPDGTMVKPDGTMIKPDGTMIKPDGTMIKPDGTMVKPDGTMIPPGTTTPTSTNGSGSGEPGAMMEYSGSLLAGSKAKAPLYDFVKADYDKATASGKVVFLYFYANWCPICREEIPKLYGAFNELQTDRVIGFRVNYNDCCDDADEQALASKLGIAYQHTKVAEKNGQRILKAPETWSKEKYLSELNRLAAQ